MNNCYLCIGICLFGADLMLNLMISHKLADVICNGLIGTLASAIICFKAFCSVCKSFRSRYFINENCMFPLKFFFFFFLKKE
jgi:hypothetical protein